MDRRVGSPGLGYPACGLVRSPTPGGGPGGGQVQGGTFAVVYRAPTFSALRGDGREAVTFLKLISEAVGQPDRMLIEI